MCPVARRWLSRLRGNCGNTRDSMGDGDTAWVTCVVVWVHARVSWQGSLVVFVHYVAQLLCDYNRFALRKHSIAKTCVSRSEYDV